ncbi:MAG: hypothetical protein LBN24_12645 [Mediterranea sp.]|jgi:hypothetical protein|nr:hypothetical protein [Mediterranea sp.]
MKIDIFSTTCFEHRKDSFGLYDEEEVGKKANPAVTVSIEDERRIASVRNESERDVYFYLANRKHPHFPYNRKDEMEQFRRETGFRLIVSAEIRIK